MKNQGNKMPPKFPALSKGERFMGHQAGGNPTIHSEFKSIKEEIPKQISKVLIKLKEDITKQIKDIIK